MPTCNACGASVVQGAETCPQCGAKQQSLNLNAIRTRERSRTGFWGCGCLAVVLTFVGALVWPQVWGAREANNRSRCRQNLKQIGLALHAYHDEYDCFPPAYIADDEGRPIHSWRVLVLPYLDDECRQLHAQYRFTEPWDGPSNKKLLDRRPAAFACPTRKWGARRQCTAYAAIFGPQCVFRGADPVSVDDITDGAAETLMVGDVTEADIPWSKPEDIDVTLHPKAGDRLGLSSDHEGGFQAVFADGGVHFMNTSLNQTTFDSLFTRNGNDKPGDF